MSVVMFFNNSEIFYQDLQVNICVFSQYLHISVIIQSSKITLDDMYGEFQTLLSKVKDWLTQTESVLQTHDTLLQQQQNSDFWVAKLQVQTVHVHSSVPLIRLLFLNSTFCILHNQILCLNSAISGKHRDQYKIVL